DDPEEEKPVQAPAEAPPDEACALAAMSLSCVFVSKSLASWRSCNWLEGSPEVRLTMRPRLTAGRSSSMSAQRCTFLYSWTARNSAAPYWLNFASPPY